MTAVLLIDDDAEFVATFGAYLERNGFAVKTTDSSERGIAHAVSGGYQIAVLNAAIRNPSGVESVRRIRRRHSIPILLLTTDQDDTDRIVGLELGADDCVAKPCAPRELVARIRAILRRANPSAVAANADKRILTAGELTMWPEQRRAEWRGQPLELTSTEFGLLELLARNVGRTIGKADLSEQVLGRPLARYDRSIDVHLSSIRHKLGVLSDGRSCIQTIFRKGYQLISD